jgi:hypothetical protein
MTFRSIPASRSASARMCRALKFTFSTPVFALDTAADEIAALAGDFVSSSHPELLARHAG